MNIKTAIVAASLTLNIIAAPGLAQTPAELPEPDQYQIKAEQPQPRTMGQIIYYGAGALATLAFLYAGYKMSDIRSVSGNSTAEAFYQGMGTVSYGMAACTVMVLAWPAMAPKASNPPEK